MAGRAPATAALCDERGALGVRGGNLGPAWLLRMWIMDIVARSGALDFEAACINLQCLLHAGRC